jgi:hypothetical protein
MEITFEKLDLIIDGEEGKVPDWFLGLTKFSYGVCLKRELQSTKSEHFVVSLPDIDGGLAAITLGALAAEIERIENNSNFEEISLNQLEVGMRVSIDSGVGGQQKVTGQVKTLALDDRTPRIEIGSRWIAAKLIQKICLIPSGAGNPQIFQRNQINVEESKNFLEHLSSTALPIHRALIDIRSTSKIIEDEFGWEFRTRSNATLIKVKDIVKPISSVQPGSGWSLVLNSSESEELAWRNLGSYLNVAELDADVSVLCSGSAILAQLEGVNSKIIFSILGRDDRQLAAIELAIRQKFEYSNPLSREIDSSTLGRGVEIITFEVPLNV